MQGQYRYLDTDQAGKTCWQITLDIMDFALSSTKDLGYI